MQYILTLIRYSVLVYARNGALWQICFLMVYLFTFSGFMTYLISRDGTMPQVEDIFFSFSSLLGQVLLSEPICTAGGGGDLL